MVTQESATTWAVVIADEARASCSKQEDKDRDSSSIDDGTDESDTLANHNQKTQSTALTISQPTTIVVGQEMSSMKHLASWINLELKRLRNTQLRSHLHANFDYKQATHLNLRMMMTTIPQTLTVLHLL